MLESFKRWVSGPPEPPEVKVITAWAKQRQLTVKTVRDAEGVVVEGGAGDRLWRMEWGASQRAYIKGHELRLRVDLGLSGALQMLAISRGLAEALEGEAFNRFTEEMQTQVDHSLPEETRWLAMYPKVDGATMGVLRPHFVVLSAMPEQAKLWLTEELAATLHHWQIQPAVAGRPVLLMTLRGRLYVRVPGDDLTPVMLDEVFRLFERAAKAAVAVSVTEVGSLPDLIDDEDATAWAPLLPPHGQ